MKKKNQIIAYLNDDTAKKLEEIKASFKKETGFRLNVSQFVSKLINDFKL